MSLDSWKQADNQKNWIALNWKPGTVTRFEKINVELMLRIWRSAKVNFLHFSGIGKPNMTVASRVADGWMVILVAGEIWKLVGEDKSEEMLWSWRTENSRTGEKLKNDKSLAGEMSLKRREKLLWTLETQRADQVLDSGSPGEIDYCRETREIVTSRAVYSSAVRWGYGRGEIWDYHRGW